VGAEGAVSADDWKDAPTLPDQPEAEADLRGECDRVWDDTIQSEPVVTRCYCKESEHLRRALKLVRLASGPGARSVIDTALALRPLP
jgi:hypothetical protein